MAQGSSAEDLLARLLRERVAANKKAAVAADSKQVTSASVEESRLKLSEQMALVSDLFESIKEKERSRVSHESLAATRKLYDEADAELAVLQCTVAENEEILSRVRKWHEDALKEKEAAHKLYSDVYLAVHGHCPP
jgi:hypothetical protein